MKDRAGTWAEVEAGSYVRDKNAKVWRVAQASENWFTLVDQNLTQGTTPGAPDAPVTIVEPTLEEAMDLVGRALGGKRLATYEQGKPVDCPPLTKDLRTVHAHFFMMHGVWTASGPGSKSALRLLETHREEHLQPAVRSHAWVNHEHH